MKLKSQQRRGRSLGKGDEASTISLNVIQSLICDLATSELAFYNNRKYRFLLQLILHNPEIADSSHKYFETPVRLKF